MTEDLRYPVGRFTAPASMSPEDRARCIGTIAGLPAAMRAAVDELDDGQLDTPYRPDGWTVRQVVHHVPDSHMNAYMRFRLALTEDVPTIRTYEEARWAELADAKSAPIGMSLDLLDALHSRWTILLRSLTPADFARTFHHPEYEGAMTLDTLLALYDWHSRHHVAHITRLREREGW